MVQIDWMLALVVAVTALGLIQWLKGLFKQAPTWVWGVGLPPLCALLAVAPPFVLIAGLAVAVAQLGYENVVKVVMAKLGVTP